MPFPRVKVPPVKNLNARFWGYGPVEATFNKFLAAHKRKICQTLRSYAPLTKYKTSSNPKMHPEIPSKTEIQRKIRRIYTKLGDFFFVYFGYFFFVFRFWRGIWGVFRGVFWGSDWFCILYVGRMITSQTYVSDSFHRSFDPPLGNNFRAPSLSQGALSAFISPCSRIRKRHTKGAILRASERNSWSAFGHGCHVPPSTLWIFVPENYVWPENSDWIPENSD